MPTAEEDAPGICKLMNDVGSLGGDAGDDLGEGELVREELADAKDLGGGPVAGGSDAFHGAGLGWRLDSVEMHNGGPTIGQDYAVLNAASGFGEAGT